MKLKSQENQSSAQPAKTESNDPYEGMIYCEKIPEEYQDKINPSHYKSGSVECIDTMEAAFGRAAVITYAEINAFKYIFRLHNKGPRVENINKAIWYLKYALGKDPRGDE